MLDVLQPMFPDPMDLVEGERYVKAHAFLEGASAVVLRFATDYADTPDVGEVLTCLCECVIDHLAEILHWDEAHTS